MSRVVLIGACGYTGKLVAKALKDEGIDYIATARNYEKLEKLEEELGITFEKKKIDVTEKADYQKAFLKNDIIINCVGPFNVYSKKFAEFVSRKEVKYLDITGEQSFVTYSMEELSGNANKSNSIMVHSCAFESFLADLLAKLIIETEQEYREISSFYWFENPHPSPGTKLTMALANQWKTYIFREGEYAEMLPGGIIKESPIKFGDKTDKAIFTPYPEVLFFSRRYKTRESGSYYLIKEGEARLFTQPAKKKAIPVEEIIQKYQKRLGDGPTEEQRKKQKFGLAILAEKIDGKVKTIRLTGRDPYGITAEVVKIMCTDIEKTRRRGVLCPRDIIQVRRFQNFLQKEEFFDTVEIDSDF